MLCTGGDGAAGQSVPAPQDDAAAVTEAVTAALAKAEAAKAKAVAEAVALEQTKAAATQAQAEAKLMTTIDEWLDELDLGGYAAAVKEEGYTTLRFLKDAEEQDLDEMAQGIGMKRPHVRTLKRAWTQLVAEADSGGAAASSSTLPVPAAKLKAAIRNRSGELSHEGRPSPRRPPGSPSPNSAHHRGTTNGSRPRPGHSSASSDNARGDPGFRLRVRARYDQLQAVCGSDAVAYESISGFSLDARLKDVISSVKSCSSRSKWFYPAKPAGWPNDCRVEPHGQIPETTLAGADLSDGDLVEACSNPEWTAFLCLIVHRHAPSTPLHTEACILRGVLLGGMQRTSREAIPPHFDTVNELSNWCGQNPHCVEVTRRMRDELTDLHTEYSDEHNILCELDPVGSFMEQWLRETRHTDSENEAAAQRENNYNIQVGSGAFAVLTALYRARSTRASSTATLRPNLNDKELRYEAQFWCGSDLSAHPSWSKGHGSWQAVRTLQNNRMIRAETKPDATGQTGQTTEVYSLLGEESLHPDLPKKCAEFSDMLFKKVDKPLLDPMIMRRAPGGGELVLLADDREKPDFVQRLKTKCEDARIKVRVGPLPVADYMWVFRTSDGDEHVLPFLVERKAFPFDLLQSMSASDGRWANQTEKMAKLMFATTKIILLEGRQFGVNWDTACRTGYHTKVANALQRVDHDCFMQGFQVQWTVHNHHTVQWLILMSKFLSDRYCKSDGNANGNAGDDPLAGPTLSDLDNMLAQPAVSTQQCSINGVAQYVRLKDVAGDIDQHTHSQQMTARTNDDLPITYVMESYMDDSVDKEIDYFQRRDLIKGGKGNLKELWQSFRADDLTLVEVADKIGEDRARYLSFRTLMLWSCWQMVYRQSYVRTVKNKEDADRLEAIRQQLIRPQRPGAQSGAARSPMRSPSSQVPASHLLVDTHLDTNRSRLPAAVHGDVTILNLNADMDKGSFSLHVVVSHREAAPRGWSKDGRRGKVINFVFTDRTSKFVQATAFERADECHEQLERGTAYKLVASIGGARVLKEFNVTSNTRFHEMMKQRDDMDDLRPDLQLMLNRQWSITPVAASQSRPRQSSQLSSSASRPPSTNNTGDPYVTHTVQQLENALVKGEKLSEKCWSICGVVEKYTSNSNASGEVKHFIIRDSTAAIAVKAWDEAIGRLPQDKKGAHWKGKKVWIYVAPDQDLPSIVPETYFQREGRSTGPNGRTINWAIELEQNVELRLSPRVNNATATSNPSAKVPRLHARCSCDDAKKVSVHELGSLAHRDRVWCIDVKVERSVPGSLNSRNGPLPKRDLILKDAEGGKIVLHVQGKNEPRNYEHLRIGDRIMITGNQALLKQHSDNCKTNEEFKNVCQTRLKVHHGWYIRAKATDKHKLSLCEACSLTGSACTHYSIAFEDADNSQQQPQAAAGGGGHATVPTEACWYGAACHNFDSDHRAKFSHSAAGQARGGPLPQSPLNKKVECPVCKRSMRLFMVDEHLDLDGCLAATGGDSLGIDPSAGDDSMSDDNDSDIDPSVAIGGSSNDGDGSQSPPVAVTSPSVSSPEAQAPMPSTRDLLDELRNRVLDDSTFQGACDRLCKILKRAKDRPNDRFRKLNVRVGSRLTDSLTTETPAFRQLHNPIEWMQDFFSCAGFEKTVDPAWSNPLSHGSDADDGTRYVMNLADSQSKHCLLASIEAVQLFSASDSDQAGSTVQKSRPKSPEPATMTPKKKRKPPPSAVPRRQPTERQSPHPSVSSRSESASDVMQLPAVAFVPRGPWRHARDITEYVPDESWHRWSQGEDLRSIAASPPKRCKKSVIKERTVFLHLMEALEAGRRVDLRRLARCCAASSESCIMGPPNRGEWAALENVVGTRVLAPRTAAGKEGWKSCCGELTPYDIVKRVAGGTAAFETMSNLETYRAYSNLDWWAALRRAGFSPTFGAAAADSNGSHRIGGELNAELSLEAMREKRMQAVDPGSFVGRKRPRVDKPPRSNGDGSEAEPIRADGSQDQRTERPHRKVRRRAASAAQAPVAKTAESLLSGAENKESRATSTSYTMITSDSDDDQEELDLTVDEEEKRRAEAWWDA